MAITGRPPKEIDLDEVDKLIEMHCTETEIAGWFRCSRSTLREHIRRAKGMPFRQYYLSISSSGKASLRRAIWQKAMEDKHAQTQQFLAKQYLGMTEKVQLEGAPTLIIEKLNGEKEIYGQSVGEENLHDDEAEDNS